MKLTDKLIIRRQKELDRVLFAKKPSIKVEKLMKIQRKYDKFIDATRKRNEWVAIENLDESEKHEMPDRDVNC